jgi:hypothetical protein
MATRNLIMVVDRKHSSKYPEGFAIHPDLVRDKSYVNMYMHHDGYPEWQGVQIANWLLAGNNGCMDGARLVKAEDPNFNPSLDKKEIAKYNKVRSNAQAIIDILTTK